MLISVLFIRNTLHLTAFSPITKQVKDSLFNHHNIRNIIIMENNDGKQMHRK